MTSETDPARRAAELVLHYDKTLAQAARILGCGVPAVQKFVQQHLDRHPRTASPASSEAEPGFLSVQLAEDVSAPPAASIPLEIQTSGGSIFRLQLSSLNEVTRLLRSLEADRC